MNKQTTHNIRRKVFWSTEVPKFHMNLSLSPSLLMYSYSILVQLNCTECGGEESKLKNLTVKLTKVQRTRKMIHTMNTMHFKSGFSKCILSVNFETTWVLLDKNNYVTEHIQICSECMRGCQIYRNVWLFLLWIWSSSLVRNEIPKVCESSHSRRLQIQGLS